MIYRWILNRFCYFFVWDNEKNEFVSEICFVIFTMSAFCLVSNHYVQCKLTQIITCNLLLLSKWSHQLTILLCQNNPRGQAGLQSFILTWRVLTLSGFCEHPLPSPHPPDNQERGRNLQESPIARIFACELTRNAMGAGPVQILGSSHGNFEPCRVCMTVMATNP